MKNSSLIEKYLHGELDENETADRHMGNVISKQLALAAAARRISDGFNKTFGLGKCNNKKEQQ